MLQPYNPTYVRKFGTSVKNQEWSDLFHLYMFPGSFGTKNFVVKSKCQNSWRIAVNFYNY